nr:hypothetical protein [uncultured Methanobacterium sp.]
MKVSKKYIGIILCLLILVILTSGCLTYSSSLNSDDQAGVNSTGGSFENQWVKFNYPSNLTITDYSTDKHIKINVYNGSEYIGGLYNEIVKIDNIVPLSESYNSTIAGRKTLRDYDFKTLPSGENQVRPSAAIYLTENATLNVIFDPSSKTSFNQVSETLVIKKDNVTDDNMLIQKIIGIFFS